MLRTPKQKHAVPQYQAALASATLAACLVAGVVWMWTGGSQTVIQPSPTVSTEEVDQIDSPNVAATQRAEVRSPTAVEPKLGEDLGEAVVTGLVFGHVYDASGAVATDCSVRLYQFTGDSREVESDGIRAKDETTPADGEFKFSALDFGIYILEAATNDGRIARRTAMVTQASPACEVSLVVRPGGRIGGRVLTDKGGAPVTDARVTAAVFWERPLGSSKRSLQTAISGEDGAFLLDGLEQGEYRLHVAHAKYADLLSESVKVEDETTCELRLSTGVSLWGYVLDAATGQAIPDFPLKLAAESEVVPLRETASDADGRYAFDHLASTVYRFSSGHDEIILSEGEVLVTLEELPAGDYQTDVQVETGGLIGGRVYDAKSGKGIPGIVAVVRHMQHLITLKSQPTDSEGHYEVRGVPPGIVSVGVEDRPAGYGSGWIIGRNETAEVTLGLAEKRNGVDLVFERGILVSGLVVDGEGAPVPGADVRAWAPVFRIEGMPPSKWTGEAGTTSKGRFEIAQIPATAELRLVARTERAASEVVGPLRVPPNGLADVRIVLMAESTGSVAGHVRDTMGRPAHVRVSLSMQDPEGRGNVHRDSGMTAADGSFLFVGVPPGSYDLLLTEYSSTGFYGSPPQKAMPLQVIAGRPITSLSLIWGEGKVGGEIRGYVFDDKGRPIIGAEVFAEELGADTISHFAMSDESGSYVLNGVPGGEYLVGVSKAGKRARRYGVHAGETDIDLTLR